MSGKVYFVSAPGRIKIGYTTKPEARLVQLRERDMETLSVIGIADATIHVERKLHEMADAHRLRGEWFRDCIEVRAIIDDFLSGKLVFNDFGNLPVAEQPVIPTISTFPDGITGGRRTALTNAICEANEIMEEVKARAARREPVSDLVKYASFLAEGVIAPLLREAD